MADYKPLADYGVIGDCHTAALISRDGSIDWYCPGRFDGPSVFCRILDAARGGYFSLAPDRDCTVERHYLDSTNVLETTFSTDLGSAKVTDFMPVYRRQPTRRGHDVGSSRRIIRSVEGESGQVRMKVSFKPTFDYARARPAFKNVPGFGALASSGDNFLSLACPDYGLSFTAGGGEDVLVADLDVKAGERRWLVLTDSDDPDRAMELPTPAQCDEQLDRTVEYWETWAGECKYDGPYGDVVLRSALTLKLLVYEPTGAIVAAPTMSLPEEIGGVRNWDYRYAWLRDSALILYALIGIGYELEAADFFEWLQDTHQRDPNPDPQVLYGIDGRRNLPETVLDKLDGYRGSRPVRSGNGAARQLQLDIYGEIMTAAYLYFKTEIGQQGADGIQAPGRLPQVDWPLLQGIVERAALRWSEPDNSIWEVRGGLQHFLYSKLMCWAALDRGIRLSTEYDLPAPLQRWKNVRQSISDSIFNDGFDKASGAFTQAFKGTALDASALLIPRAGLLPPTDPRMQSTIARIQSDLLKGGLVYRYLADDGLQGGEGAFISCSLWLVDALALSGKIAPATELFEHVTSFANDLGLMSEEIVPSTGELVGNFPQGFTHMALINSAINLMKAEKHGPEHQPENEAQRAQKAKNSVIRK